MSRLSAAAILAFIGIHGAASAAVGVAPGTQVELMVLEEVNTRISAPGSVVRLRLNKPVEVDGVVALPVGTLAYGRIDTLQKSAIAMTRGTLRVRMSRIAGPDGDIPLVDEPMVYQARGGKADDVAKVLLVPMYALFSPANSAKLKAGEIVFARVAGETPVSPDGAASAR